MHAMTGSKNKVIHINETHTPAGIDILTRVRSFVELRVGYFNLLQRIRKKNPGAKIFYSHSDPKVQEYFLSRHPNIFPFSGEAVDLEFQPGEFQPWDLIQNIPNGIEEDLALSKEIHKWRPKFKTKHSKFEIVGKAKHIHIHPDSIVYPGVVIDTTSGPVIIDKDVTVTSFSFLEGPLYIGSGARIDNARITGGTVVGKMCRIGGEVENSIIQDYSNKHHEGFLGHSCVGSWVNLGALATTSDLKNNYGTVVIQSGEESVNTGTIKFGSILGDFAKIGIGVMLNTGTSVDVGSNLVDSRISGYIPPFTWLDPGKKYRWDRFLQDTKKIMARRSVEMTEDDERNLENIYSKFNP